MEAEHLVWGVNVSSWFFYLIAVGVDNESIAFVLHTIALIAFLVSGGILFWMELGKKSTGY